MNNRANEVRTSDLIDHGAWSGYQKFVLALCAIVIVLDGVDILAIGLAAPAILADWGVTKGEFAPAIAAGLLGMAMGGTLGGMVGDRIGRRHAIIGSVLVFGLATIALVIARDVFTLGTLRLVAGLGLGSALPNVTALVTEMTPVRYRSLGVATVITCVPIGGAVAGLVASYTLPVYGWQGLFVVAGILPLPVAVILFWSLPESPGFLAQHADRWPKLRGILARMGHATSETTLFVNEFRTQAGQDDSAETSILSRSIRMDTFALWFAFFSCLTAVYFSYNWIPTLLADRGHDLSVSSGALTYFNVGGIIASVAAGWLVARFGSKAMLLALATLGSLVTVYVIFAPHLFDASGGALGALFALQGAAILGLQVLLYPLAAHVYPTAMRATGVGTAAGIGRLGAFLSANVGAILLSWHGTVSFFAAVLVCLAFTATGVVAVSRQIRRDHA